MAHLCNKAKVIWGDFGMEKINMTEMANKVANSEDICVDVNILQIKEVMRLLLEELSECKGEEILELVNRYKERKYKRIQSS